MITNLTMARNDLPTVYLHGFSGEGSSLAIFAQNYSGDNSLTINLPGFGGTSVPEAANDNIYTYCLYVWREIRRVVPEGKIRLVGHSHGTMVGFVLAVQHPDDIESLDLFCPVARPKLIPRILSMMINICRHILPTSAVITVLKWQWFVDIVTAYSLRSDWSPEIRQRITAMRRKEAAYYTPVTFDLMAQARQFKKIMKDVHIETPTRICYVSDDNVSGARDHEWYQQHANVEKIVCLTGGHLCVVAEPERIAQVFKEVR